jgi:hypothetical protein
MAQTTNRLIAFNPATNAATYLDFTATGTILPLICSSFSFIFRESNGFEPYTKVGVILLFMEI